MRCQGLRHRQASGLYGVPSPWQKIRSLSCLCSHHHLPSGTSTRTVTACFTDRIAGTTAAAHI
jgi:hypothetical protein